jgi:hypothetical protein
MGYKWKPTATQKREFAERMKNPIEQAAYYQRKNDRATKRRSTSIYDYTSAGGYYIPTKEQYDFAMRNPDLFTSDEENSRNQVIFGYSCSEKVHHDFIHVVNEKRRAITYG